ncbi:Pirin [hydrothermal vent metagenome]|uniref:Pirin n=1 Tax=hydrothermal vent metagenome TaxID=652676 RepID=A0A3B1B7P1_9ZZZZ
MFEYNKIKTVIKGMPTSDGDGVQLTRLIGTHQLPDLDPFLLLDHFGSDQASDYIGGFPSHPHRGFETVTYMLKGKMRHQDSVGNNGLIEAGGIQWMSAGSGIIHSEMPEQTEGLLSGFQLWVNLPSAAKMSSPKYQEHMAADIPVEQHHNGTRIKVIAGKTQNGTTGIIDNQYVNPNYWDVHLPKNQSLLEHIDKRHNAFIYLYEGQIKVGEQPSLAQGELAVLSAGKSLKIHAKKDSQFILVSGMPLNEPIERGGPFVMNTREEIQQAFNDYQAGNLTG